MTGSVITALLLGAGFGLGLLTLGYGLFPSHPSLARSLALIDRGPPSTPIQADGQAGWAARVGRPLAAPLAALKLPTASVRKDLALLDKPIQRHLAEKATAALAGLLLTPLLAPVLAVGGMGLPPTVLVGASLALMLAGFVVPDLAVKTQARKRRDDLRHTLSAFLDLTVISLAGGAGVEAALADAAAAGNGWAAMRLRGALQAAESARRPPWAMLAELGETTGVAELTELAASITLAGTEGAKIRATLAAKAASLRAHQLTEAESAAQSATERMSLPVVGMFTGFLIFIGYPALAGVLGL